MNRLDEGYALGLDLGTTFSCIGVFRNGGVEIIPNRNGEKVTPSIVTVLSEEKILIGEDAEDYLVKNYDTSIYAIKRFIGRDITKKEVQEELKMENFPYKIIVGKNNRPEVEIKNKIHISLEKISSFIIKKMVESAEAYLNKRVNKLVITIPHNFSDEQRKSTIEAAKLAGIEVLRIINEPTAAALAYGLQEKNQLKNDEKILIFDLGGGTFDVTILSIDKDQKNNQNFNVISTGSNKFLGGEDFDNKLVDYVLDDFCKKIDESIENIKRDKKAIKRLKISCENIKRVLSVENETTLCINNFYNGQDILIEITRHTFDDICEDLFEKLEKPMDDALKKAKEKNNNKEIKIGEIILVGGSTKIPKIKAWLKKMFKCKINDLINPDETVAYGATLMAAKILIKKEKMLLGFNLMDITPLSLGVEVVNEDEKEEIRKEGGKMSVIIKRGESIPCTKTRRYITVEDNQESVPIIIYEGENAFVKYNHKLKKKELTGLTKKPKGKVNIEVKFYIDANGILNVTGTEVDPNKSNSIELKLKADMMNYTDEEIEEFRKKMKNITKIKMDKALDYSNLKETLKEYLDSYNDCEDNEEKFEILNNYNNTLEEFIDLFDKDNFDNEIIIEKYYLYIKLLFISYGETLKLEEDQNNEEIKNHIIKKTKEYISDFIMKSSGYLINLVEKIKNNFPKKIFYEIIVLIMEKYNERGKNCLKEMKKLCKYHSLIYFEKTKWYFEKYIEKITNLGVCDKTILNSCKLQKETSDIYIRDIHSGAILLLQDSQKTGKLVQTFTGFTKMRKGLSFGNEQEKEKNKIVLENYEKLLAECQNKNKLKNLSKLEKERIMKEEAICIANIIKINHSLLGNTNYSTYCQLGERCIFLAEKLGVDKNTEWFKEFMGIYHQIKELNKQMQIPQSINEIKDNIRTKFKEEFTQIDNKFNETRNENIGEFIKYILETTPYNGYKEEKKILEKKNEKDLINYLSIKYHPDGYELTDNPDKQLRFCKIEYIASLLNSLKSNTTK